ncbi:MAG: EamA family transporter [Roseiflexus sp.]|nr:EamA family transporter [Roseiflexus sp.]
MEMSRIHSTPRHTHWGVLWITLAAILWGTVGLASRALFQLAETTPLSIGFARMAIAALTLNIICWVVNRRHMFAVRRTDTVWMILIGVTMAIYQVCFFAAIARVGVAITVLVTLCSAPVLVALLERVFLGQQLTRRVALALLCALGGTSLLVGSGSSVSSDMLQTLDGALLALGASFGFALMVLCSRMLADRYHPLIPITWGLSASAFLLLPFVLAFGLAIDFPLEGWLVLLYLGAVPTALAFVLFLVGVRHVTATVASIVTLLEPLTATILAALLFGERFGTAGAAGAGLLLLAIMLLIRRSA